MNWGFGVLGFWGFGAPKSKGAGEPQCHFKRRYRRYINAGQSALTDRPEARALASVPRHLRSFQIRARCFCKGLNVFLPHAHHVMSRTHHRKEIGHGTQVPWPSKSLKIND